uniref:Uncharacterized protein n=1 Tax=Caenorhabditis japonica TaxID=281687 RepID=A0A8R1HJ25_CAEJA
MNPSVVVRRLLFLLYTILNLSTNAKPLIDDKYTILTMSNAVIGEPQFFENEDDVKDVVRNQDKFMELYSELKPPKEPPMSIMSGNIPDHLIMKMADYLFGLLQGTGEVVKPMPTTTTPFTPELLPFRSADLAVNRNLPQVVTNFGEIRRKSSKFRGVSRRKSEKLWRKTRMERMMGRI